MRLLLDTHFLLWLMLDPDKITPREWTLIEAAETLHVSAISLWEIRMKWRASDRDGNRKGQVSAEEALAFVVRNDMHAELLSPEDCATPLASPLAHKDPFDEMLLLHAQRLGARLLTRDGKLVAHPLALLA